MELGIHDPWLFVAAGLALNITPGPDSAYVVGRSLQTGWQGGAMAALGIGAGCLVHIAAAAIGLSALLAASATAFLVIKLAGAAYLVVIGVRMLLLAKLTHAAPVPAIGLAQIFREGMLTNALNPKVALFFLAFLPQFVDNEAPARALSFLILGLIFNLTGTLWNFGLALVASLAAARVRSWPSATGWLHRALGAFFIWLGIRIALLQSR